LSFKIHYNPVFFSYLNNYTQYNPSWEFLNHRDDKIPVCMEHHVGLHLTHQSVVCHRHYLGESAIISLFFFIYPVIYNYVSEVVPSLQKESHKYFHKINTKGANRLTKILLFLNSIIACYKPCPLYPPLLDLHNHMLSVRSTN
jgi:hypothetical protein